ncbi:VanW family protein, partial [Staphylococcus aureus]
GHKPIERRKRLSERYPMLYTMAVQKEIIRRHLKDRVSRISFANKLLSYKLPNLVYQHESDMIKTGRGIDPGLQENKAFNLELSSSKMNQLEIKPGESFSFWHLVGKADKKHGYKDGRVIINDKVKSGTGGGLCNLANTINLLIIHSPLTITEVHYHSDALAPDSGVRKPLSNGTSVAYNYVDYRFNNTTDQTFQLCVWCEDKQLKAELRSERDIPYQYRIVEEDHHFVQEHGIYYRKSRIYKVTEEKGTSKEIKRKLLLDNHSQVMFDYDLIPEGQIRTN